MALKSRDQLVFEGRVFRGAFAAAGGIIPIYSNTTQQFGLWNPAGNDRIAEIFEIGVGSYVDTTLAASGYVLGILKNAPAQLATGAAITAFTETTPENANPTMTGGNKVKFAQGATITVTAPTLHRHLNIIQDAFAATGAVTMPREGGVRYFDDRTMWVFPGTAIFLAGNIAPLGKFAPQVVWGEHDFAGGKPVGL